jgi:dienelactone hydrolase
MMRRYACAAVAAGFLSINASPAWPQANGDPLPRRAALGVALAIDAAGNVVVSAVPAGSAAAAAGVAQELAGYQTALRALLADPAVDRNRVFLIGLSLGGFFAPLLARDVPVAGISAYGTIAFIPTAYPGRSERFFREIVVVDILAAWAAVDARVQLLHGTYDGVSTASDHAKIAAIVNGVHPGRAEHREFEGLDHCWTRHKTPEAGRDNCGGGEATTSVTDAVLDFIGRP